MWTETADDRSFVCELSREIVTAVAAEELVDFETLITPYFADPHPPRPIRRANGATTIPRPNQPYFTPVVPAVISAALDLLVLRIQDEAAHAPPDLVRSGLKRLVRRRGTHLNERLWVRPSPCSYNGALALIVYIYTLPVPATIALTDIEYVALETGRIYGLDLQRAARLTLALTTRLCGVPEAS